jgi:hypothetical protein
MVTIEEWFISHVGLDHIVVGAGEYLSSVE